VPLLRSRQSTGVRRGSRCRSSGWYSSMDTLSVRKGRRPMQLVATQCLDGQSCLVLGRALGPMQFVAAVAAGWRSCRSITSRSVGRSRTVPWVRKLAISSHQTLAARLKSPCEGDHRETVSPRSTASLTSSAASIAWCSCMVQPSSQAAPNAASPSCSRAVARAPS